MYVLLTSLALLFIIALVAGIVRNIVLEHRPERGETDSLPSIKQPRPDGCCGKHEVCEKDELLAASLRGKADYYEDEELDAYGGTPSDAYTPEQVEEFRHVLYTMRPEEVGGWLRSLQLRGVEVPDGLKDEVLLLLED